MLALSARPYAQAAKRSGFCVSVIDGFLDQETLAIAQHAQAVPFDEKGFEINALKNALEALNAEQFVGCIYASGVEAQPELLALIGQKMPVFGQAPAIIQQVKNATSFFATLDAFNIAHPLVFTQLPEQLPPNFLVKSAHGAGGQHIRYAEPTVTLDANEYLQALINGESVSVLFLVEKNAHVTTQVKAHVIGFNLQWTNPTQTQPFRFGGIASNHDLPEKIKSQLREIVQTLAEAFALVGLNSLDVVIQDEKIFVLEINPRLSASVDLYAQDLFEKFNLDLIQLHIQSCLGAHFSETVKNQLAILPKNTGSKAMAIVYAEQDSALNDIAWPAWVNDKPINHSITLKKSPVCSVISYETSALLAKSAVEIQVDLIQAQLESCSVLAQ